MSMAVAAISEYVCGCIKDIVLNPYCYVKIMQRVLQSSNNYDIIVLIAYKFPQNRELKQKKEIKKEYLCQKSRAHG